VTRGRGVTGQCGRHSLGNKEKKKRGTGRSYASENHPGLDMGEKKKKRTSRSKRPADRGGKHWERRGSV